jgi:hypothetical protein
MLQSYVTRVVVEMHNSFEKEDSIHGEAVHSRLSLDTALV